MQTAYLLSYHNARNGINDIDMVVGVYAERSFAIAHIESMGDERANEPVPHDHLPAKDLLSVVATYKRNLSPKDVEEYIEIEEWCVR